MKLLQDVRWVMKGGGVPAGDPGQMSEPLDALGEALAGRHRLRREPGRGGMAQVFLADDLRST